MSAYPTHRYNTRLQVLDFSSLAKGYIIWAGVDYEEDITAGPMFAVAKCSFEKWAKLTVHGSVRICLRAKR